MKRPEDKITFVSLESLRKQIYSDKLSKSSKTGLRQISSNFFVIKDVSPENLNKKVTEATIDLFSLFILLPHFRPRDFP